MGLLDGIGSHREEVVIELLRGLAKKQGMLFPKKMSDLQLSLLRA